MGNVAIEEIQYGNWGRCVRITNGEVDLVATLDFGPRIMRFGVVDGPNEFFEDVNDQVNNTDASFDIYGDEGHWHIYGGHRLWTSPEALPRSYYPDNAPVEYIKIDNGICLIPEPQAWTELQFELHVVMSEEGEVTVTHKITNIGAWAVKLAPWALSVMQVGGLEVIPQPKKNTGFLGNRILALWPYSDMSDKRVNWGTDYITIRTNSIDKRPFKLGINNEHGFVTYFNHGNLFVKKYSPVDGGSYPDGGVSYETYTNNLFCELETLGEYKKIQPDETVIHVENWKLIPNVSEPETVEEITQTLKEYNLL